MSLSHIRPITISTLSPVHIGCDEVYEPSNFVIDEGLLHALDPADLMSELDDKERKELARLADGREPIGALQRFFRERSKRFADVSGHQVDVAAAIVREYEAHAGKPTQRSTTGEATYNVFPIARTAYRQIDNSPYLPGSSLKGSIRTAWLNSINRGKALTQADKASRDKSRALQQRLLNYIDGKFENDPFRLLALADAQPEQDAPPPPSRILYSISKKKRISDRMAPALKVFLESIPDALPAAFHGELRLRGDTFSWDVLCDVCNAYYKPRLEEEFKHDIFGPILDVDWKRLISNLLSNELDELIAARQGFLLRVGRHSGAESMTLDGIRDIKILGPRVEGKQTFDFRPHTTEKRFASLTKTGDGGLLPFGWIWVDACDDAHRHISDSLRQKLAARSQALRDAHHDRLFQLEERQERRARLKAEAQRERARQEAEALQKAHDEALAAARRTELSPQALTVEDLIESCQQKSQLGRRDPCTPGSGLFAQALAISRDALDESSEWTNDEKLALADALEAWLPRVIEKLDRKDDWKDARKKLKLAQLRPQS